MMLEVVEGAEVGEEEQVVLLAVVIGHMMMWQTWFFPMGQGRMLMRRVRNKEKHTHGMRVDVWRCRLIF